MCEIHLSGKRSLETVNVFFFSVLLFDLNIWCLCLVYKTKNDFAKKSERFVPFDLNVWSLCLVQKQFC